MRATRVLPYIAALIFLAWILGSLARTGTGATSILANSYWLVYLVYLLPFLALASMVVAVIYLVVNWRVLSDALGWGMAQKRRMRKRKTSKKAQAIVWATFWGIALGTLFWKCGTIPCQPSNSTATLSNQTSFVVNATVPLPLLPGVAGLQVILADLFSGWLALAFLAVLVVGSVILARSVKVSLDEIRQDWPLREEVQQEGVAAVEEALGMLKAEEPWDPRTRIMRCYERMVKAAASLGANVRVDQTARELEAGIRRTFQLKGRGIADLTMLFEEARYSLHSMTMDDSGFAEKSLLEIEQELNGVASVED